MLTGVCIIALGPVATSGFAAVVERQGDYTCTPVRHCERTLPYHQPASALNVAKITIAARRQRVGPKPTFADDPPGPSHGGRAPSALRYDCYCTISGDASASRCCGPCSNDSAKLWLSSRSWPRKSHLRLRNDPALHRFWRCIGATSIIRLDRSRIAIGFPLGNPGIYFALADGSELHSQLGYNGPDDLEGLRKKDPDAPKPAPEPKKPEPVNPDVDPSPDKFDPRYVLLVAIGAIGVLLFLKGRPS